MMEKVWVWHVLELEFSARESYCNAYMDTELRVTFTSPEGRQMTVPGFWYRGDTWKVRFAPPKAGRWEWVSAAGNTADSGLHGKKGCFTAEEYAGNNPIYQHGFLKVNENRRGFIHADGTPFFWLGDTVWAISGKATTEEWKEYVEYRSKQGFNIVQINALPQHDDSEGAVSRQPFPAEGRDMFWDRPDPEYFQYLDGLMEITAQAGMFTAMVALWFDYVPGTNQSWDFPNKKGLTPPLAAAYGRYLAARYAAYGTIWMVTGDSGFDSEESVSLYDAAAYAIKESSPCTPLMTAHLYGGLCTPEMLNRREWLSFHMYQSGHGKNTVQLSRECAEKERSYLPVRPVLNGEPCYEGIGYCNLPERVSREAVREVSWISILGGGNAGITYGAHGLWSWHCEGDAFRWADMWQMPEAWQNALRFSGAEDVVRMKRFFEALPWWTLEPASRLLPEDKSGGQAAAVTPDEGILIVYIPSADRVKISIGSCEAYTGIWFDPSRQFSHAASLTMQKDMLMAEPPNWEGDAVLLLKRR